MADLCSDDYEPCPVRLDMVYRLALSQTREPADASDVCQETFISLLKDATVFQDDEHLQGMAHPRDHQPVQPASPYRVAPSHPTFR